ncbi:MAG: hypothetical protein R3F55_09375 [Alphaproteobacteria bacterium]
MTSYAEMSPDERAFVEHLFTAAELMRALNETGQIGTGHIGFSRLHAYVAEGRPVQDPAIDAALQRDPKLAATCDALVRNLAPYAAPVAAAAADTKPLTQRFGNGWRLNLLEVRNAPDQRWVVIRFEREDVAPPRALYAGTVRHALPAMTDGQVQFRIGVDSRLAQAISDAATELFLL